MQELLILILFDTSDQNQSSVGVLQKKMFLQILQNSQENTCAKDALLMNFQIYRVLLYQKGDSSTDVFL